MDLGISSKPALVMGASQGIGSAIAKRLAEAGCAVVGVARTAEPLEKAMSEIRASGGNAHAIAADMTDAEQTTRIFSEATQQFGQPLIVVYNPPTPRAATFMEADPAAYSVGFDELVHGFARVVKHAVPGMAAARWGRIVTVGSATVRQPMRTAPGSFGYAVANTGRLAAASVSRGAANELAHLGITVNTIATGSINTETAHRFYADRAAEQGITAEEFDRLRFANIPMGREGSVEEISGLAAFLCSQQAGFITGETVLCDGGLSNVPY